MQPRPIPQGHSFNGDSIQETRANYSLQNPQQPYKQHQQNHHHRQQQQSHSQNYQQNPHHYNQNYQSTSHQNFNQRAHPQNIKNFDQNQYYSGMDQEMGGQAHNANFMSPQMQGNPYYGM